MEIIRLLCVLTVVVGFVVQAKGSPQVGRVIILVGASALVIYAAARLWIHFRRRRQSDGEGRG